MNKKKVAILIDAGHLQQGLFTREQKGNIEKIFTFCAELTDKNNEEIFRIFYYDCPPYDGKQKQPISKTIIDFASSDQYRDNTELLHNLSVRPLVSLRAGALKFQGWRLKLRKDRKGNFITPDPKTISDQDFLPDFKQKQVDIKIGLDVAWMAIKRIVDIIILVTGDTDFAPVLKFARNEGLQVYMGSIAGQKISDELLIHSDGVRMAKMGK